MSTEYRVQLESFEGPIDLLLYLIRREEVDIHDIPIARIAQQYVEHLAGIDRIDIELAGEFLLMAATLTEIKSRVLAGQGRGESAPQSESAGGDPRAELVQQLLAYKRNRDLADALDQRRRDWERRMAVSISSADARRAITRDARDLEVELDDLTIQDLIEAFARIAESVNFAALGAHEVIDDATPLELHAEDLLDHLRRAGAEVPFRSVFEGRSRSDMLGLFLAMLELVRQRRLRVRQADEGIVITAAPEDTVEPEAASPAASGPANGESK